MNRLQALYPARIWHEDDVYYVQFLDLENGFTFGENLTEAKEMAVDVLNGLLASALMHNEPILLPQRVQGDDIYLIAPTIQVQVALLLRLIRANLPQEKMALAIGETKQTYQKIEQSHKIPILSQLQEIAQVFGKELVIEFRG